MSGIVCAIRGGPDSKPTIERAIAQSKDTGLTLYLLYVVNLDFLTHSATSRLETVTREMHQMGEFILLTAQAAAAAKGVLAEAVVRQGNVEEEITALCHQIGAEYIVLGQPGGEQDETAIGSETLNPCGSPAICRECFAPSFRNV